MMNTSAQVMQHKAFQVEKLDIMWKWAGLLMGILIFARVVPSAGLILCAVCALYALRGTKETIEALGVLALLLLMSASGVSLGRWVVLFAGCGRVLWDSVFLGGSAPRVLRVILLFSATALLFALVVSYLPVVSAFKVIAFTIGVGTTLVGFHRTAHLRQYWLRWFYTLGLFIILVSMPLYGTSMGYTRGAGFQGILSHPQTFGPVLAPITAMLTGMLLFGTRRSWLLVVGMAFGWFGIYASQSRTALFATVLALGLAGLIGLFKAQWRPVIFGAFSRPITLIGFVLILSVAVVKWDTLQTQVVAFILKDDVQEEAVEDGQELAVENGENVLTASRGELIERSMNNFRSAPITGIGFGVPSDPMAKDRVEIGFLGLPVGASVEKGFMPSAVLEETGLTGAVLVLIILYMLMRPIVAQGSITLLWMFLSAFLINFGEMVFFSVGGMGFYLWIIMAFCYMYAASAPASHPVPIQRPALGAGAG